MQLHDESTARDSSRILLNPRALQTRYWNRVSRGTSVKEDWAIDVTLRQTDRWSISSSPAAGYNTIQYMKEICDQCTKETTKYSQYHKAAKCQYMGCARRCTAINWQQRSI